MDAFDEAVQRLQRDLDNLRGLLPQNGDGPPPKNGGKPVTPEPSNPNLAIGGVEATQAIQYFAQGSGGGAANSLGLVPHKTTVMRVYPDIATRNPNLPVPATLTGEIDLREPSLFPLGDPQSGPINGPIAAKTFANTNRGNANDTLNFRLLGWQCKGWLEPRVRLFDPAHPGGGPLNRDPNFTGPWTSFKVPILSLYITPPGGPLITDYRLRLVCVRIIYTGPDASGNPTQINPVSENDVISQLSDSFLTKTFPIEGINYIGFPVAEFKGDLRVEPAGWDALIQMLRNERAAASSNDIYLGVLPDGVPIGKILGVGTADGVAATLLRIPGTLISNSKTLAHEIGHAYGRLHARCGFPPGLDPNYPTCGTLPNGSICEFGFETSFSTVLNPNPVLNPNQTFDFMNQNVICPSANDSHWISPYTFQGLRNAIRARDWSHHPHGAALPPREAAVASAAAPVAPPEAAVEREYLHLNFRMHRDGSVHLLPSFHLSGLAPEAEGSPRAPVAFELRAADGQVLGVYPCYLTNPNVEPDSPHRDFYKMVPWNGETRYIAFFRDEEQVAEVDVEEQTPEITSGPVTELEGDRNQMNLEWEGRHETKTLTYIVRYSNDGGENWLGLAAGLTEPKFVVDLDTLPGGERCVFQIVATSTIRTTVAETEPVSVPVKPRRPFIVSPERSSTFLQGESVVLAGVGHSPDFETAPLDEVVWTSNVAGFIGYGHEVITETLAPGLHKITLGVTDGLGGEASADVLIRVNPKEE